MKRVLVSLLVSLGVVGAAPPVAAPLAQASNASLTRALKAYEKRLTRDIGYLSGFSTPRRSAAPRALRKLSAVRRDLTGAKRAAKRQKASTRSGRRGRAEVLWALSTALAATRDGRACATLARSGKHAAAVRRARAEQRKIDKAIRLFESGGRRLHLF